MRTKPPHLSNARLVLGCLLLTCLAFAQRTGEGAVSQDPIPKPPKINFVDIAARAGLTAKTVAGDEKRKKYIIETTGSGAAFFDYDNDGWPCLLSEREHSGRFSEGAGIYQPPLSQQPRWHVH